MHSFRLSVTMDVSDVKASTSSGSVHGVVVGELSPVKTSSKNRAVKYFDGRFSEGKKTVQLVSFDPNLRNKFLQLFLLTFLLYLFLVVSLIFLSCPSSPLWPRKLSYYKASVNYSGNSLCDERTYQPYMEHQ